MKKYKNAESNVEELKRLGAQVLYGVDATQMRHVPNLSMRKFDRIVFNFPHAGFHGQEDSSRMISREHTELVQGFFRNASGMLRPNGEVHVTHKTSKPFCYWKIEELALGSSLALMECVQFRMEDYPFYRNKRGDGKRSDEPFHLGDCRTFKFTLAPHFQFARTHVPSRRYQCPQAANGEPIYTGFMNNVARRNSWFPYDGQFNHVFPAQGRGGVDLAAARIAPEPAAAYSPYQSAGDQEAQALTVMLLVYMYYLCPEIANLRL
ncbi:Heavy metal-associated isoprenylated plant protein 41 [Linum perenne]